MVYGKCLLSDWEGSRQPNVKSPESKPKIRGKGQLRTSIMQQHTIDLFTSTILGVLVSYEQNILFLNFSSSSFTKFVLKIAVSFPKPTSFSGCLLHNAYHERIGHLENCTEFSPKNPPDPPFRPTSMFGAHTRQRR